MRYEKGHKAATRQRILETAVARFKRDGIESVGVADLMAEAGLTHGGFYSHFTSKEALVRAVLEEAANHSAKNFARRIDEGGLEKWIRSYLRPEHRDNPSRGCVAAALGSEVVRYPQATRQAFSDNLEKILVSVSTHLPSGMTPKQKRRTATGIFATLMGAMQMARAVNDLKLSDEILESGIASALAQAQIEH